MLVLTRKDDESIYIGPGIKVMVVQSKNGRCRLGVSAPQDVPILRGEFVEGSPTEPGRSDASVEAA